MPRKVASHDGAPGKRGKSSPLHVQAARELQCAWHCGRIAGSASREPAGTITSRPLRVRCGKGDPQRAQKVLAKLCAEGRSNRTTRSCPAVHVNWLGLTRKLEVCALPVSLRQREQWHKTKLRNGSVTRYVTAPQRQLPRRICSMAGD